MEGVNLDNWEKQIYTLFSMLQTIKVAAYDQKLNKPTKTTATNEDLKEATRLMMEGSEEAQVKLEEIQKRMSGWQLETFKESYKHKIEHGISLFKKNVLETK